MEAMHLIKYSGSRELLETLVKFPARQFTINELAGEAGVPFASAWRLVKKWEPAGLIETGRVGRSVTVKLHKSDYLDSILSLLQISKSPQAFAANALRAILAKDKGVKEAYLFGSVARGEETPSSDIDVAILASKNHDANRLIFEVFEKYGAKIVPISFKAKKELDSFMVGKNGVKLK
ncbi:MAG: nucleotidyltransferase domain-containing protein [Candidatus Micrarchaeia archaeon]|jgi:predicted nucleotidyltransferase